MKFVTVAAVAAFAAGTPVWADPVVKEQAKAEYHQAKADAITADRTEALSQEQANSASANAADAQVQADANQSDASALKAKARASQADANSAQAQASASQNEAINAQATADAAAAEKNAALDRAANARDVVRSQSP